MGRAGRGVRPGEAIVQTIYPEHYSIEFARRQDYRGFFEKEFAYRQAMHYPPAVALINAIVKGASFEGAMQDARRLVAQVVDHRLAQVAQVAHNLVFRQATDLTQQVMEQAVVVPELKIDKSH